MTSNSAQQISNALIELKSEATDLTNSLQRILDTQAAQVLGGSDSSNATDQGHNKTSIRKTRSKLRRTMLELASVNDALADTYLREYSAKESELKDATAKQKRNTRLREQVKWIRIHSKEAIRLKKVEGEEVKLRVRYLACKLDSIQKKKKGLY